jgi:hypothetical protein
MERMREPQDATERKAIADIEDHGWHVLKVMDDSEGPAFAYTVGLFHSFRHPELIVIGLPPEVAHSVLNVAGEAIRRGVRYSEGAQSGDFLEHRACRFRKVPEVHYRSYLGWDLWFYDGNLFPALQVVWADQDGRWPWEPSVDSRVRDIQPVIEDQPDPPWAPRATG